MARRGICSNSANYVTGHCGSLVNRMACQGICSNYANSVTSHLGSLVGPNGLSRNLCKLREFRDRPFWVPSGADWPVAESARTARIPCQAIVGPWWGRMACHGICSNYANSVTGHFGSLLGPNGLSRNLFKLREWRDTPFRVPGGAEWPVAESVQTSRIP